MPHIERPLQIFVAGGTGFVGCELVTRLVRQGHQVRLVTRNAARADQLLPLSSVEVLAGNVYSVDFLRSGLADCDVAINLVGVLNTHGFGSRDFQRAHVQFTTTLLTAIREAGVPRLLQMSALNADPERGVSHYLRTKGEAERRVRAASSWLDWSIFQPSVIFGAADSLTNRFVRLLRLSAGWLPLACAHARFAPIYVGDVADAFVRALHGAERRHQTYQLCGPEVMTLEELVRLSASLAGQRCRLWPLPPPLAHLQAALLEFVPGKPFSLDNFRSLQVDSICQRPDTERLGIAPSSLRALAPLWLSPLRVEPI